MLEAGAVVPPGSKRDKLDPGGRTGCRVGREVGQEVGQGVGQGVTGAWTVVRTSSLTGGPAHPSDDQGDRLEAAVPPNRGSQGLPFVGGALSN